MYTAYVHRGKLPALPSDDRAARRGSKEPRERLNREHGLVAAPMFAGKRRHCRRRSRLRSGPSVRRSPSSRR